MSRFFRATRPFLRTISSISTPLCVSFGVASAVPTNKDAPAYVQEVFKQFGDEYTQKANAPSIFEETHSQMNEKPKFAQEPVEEQQSEPDSEETNQQMQPIKAISAFNPNQYLARFIDHTVLKPKSTEQDIRKMCAEAIKHHFFSVCCNPYWVSLCKQLLKDSDVKICSVVGFPLGSNTTLMKVLEAQTAVRDGADEIDMVMNIGCAKSGDWEFVYEDIAMVVQAVTEEIPVKVILETCLLDDAEIAEACGCAVNAGAKFVKTSTGFGGGGATLHHVSLMRKCVDEEAAHLGMEIGSVLVKASGGVRDGETAKQMLRAGADRIGASSGIKIIGFVDEETQAYASDDKQY